ncbi:hypothetical protein C8R44DRAFT_878206 [Mycena epipterygia]|nr:hypothetical protein C8R44DRAFT_878206 [Mycena epipterygia]
MPDREKGPTTAKVMDSSEEAAAAKLWAVYISEAEKYDKSLIESWKSDMEGMLIFAGLFSASLTAFIIESYKTLVPDSGDSAVQLLAQISQQLAAAANGSIFQPPPSVHFTPPASSLVCNALWFISLGLSLTCALIATLLEQWARNFLHKTEMRSAPVIRARIFSYLYYGLKRFNMHTIVDAIPLLLHASLLFFFAGLVAFLIPINLGIALLAAGLLVIVTAVYSVLTLLPLWYLDCPYQTPLSGAFWPISRRAVKMWRSWLGAAEDEQNAPDSSETMVEMMSHHATTGFARSARDYRALVWTVKSLADDSELEPFVEAIPDVLWGPDLRRYTYEDHIQRLMRDPDLKLQFRIAGLLDSCDSGLLLPEAANRRRVACCKALWATASLQRLDPTWKALDFSHWSHSSLFRPNNDFDHYHIPVATLMGWSTFCHVKNDLTEILRYLARCAEDLKNGHTPNLQPATSLLKSLQSILILPIHSVLVNQKIPDYIRGEIGQPSDMIPVFVRAIEDISTNTPHRIMFSYFQGLANLKSPPYRWRSTQATIRLNSLAVFSALKNDLETTLDIVVSGHRDILNHPTTQDWTHTIIRDLCSWWKPDQASTPTPLPSALIYYFNHCQSDVLGQLLYTEGLTLWSAVPTTLADGPSTPNQAFAYTPLGIDEVLTALWHMSSPEPWGSPIVLIESVLEAVLKLRTSFITVSVVAVLKAKIFDNLYNLYFGTSEISSFRHSLLPMPTAIDVPEDFLSAEFKLEITDGNMVPELLADRVTEAKIALLAEFLESFKPDIVPYKGPETVRQIGSVTPRAKIHEDHQIRLASAIHRVSCQGEPHGTELLDALVLSPMFELYADSRPAFFGPRDRTAWLDSSIARGQITAIISGYVRKLSSVSGSPPILARLEAILQGLDYLHANS